MQNLFFIGSGSDERKELYQKEEFEIDFSSTMRFLKTLLFSLYKKAQCCKGLIKFKFEAFQQFDVKVL